MFLVRAEIKSLQSNLTLEQICEKEVDLRMEVANVVSFCVPFYIVERELVIWNGFLTKI
jgi:hypothetical protein